jgi:hypothetical protein
MGLSFADAQTLNAQAATGNASAAVVPQGPMSFEDAQSADTAASLAQAPTHPVQAPSGNMLADAGNFLRTAAIKAGSGLASLAAGADPTARIAVDLARGNNAPPLQNASPERVEDAAYKTRLGPEYQPQTEGGRLAMAGTTGALTGLATGGESLPATALNTIRAAAASMGGQGAADAGLPPWLGVAAAPLLELIGRAGIGAAKVGAPSLATARNAITNPTNAGQNAAGRVLAGVDNSGAGLPAISDADLANAETGVKSATTAIGTGDTAANVGAQIRGDLTTRQQALKQARTDTTADLAAARDASTVRVELDPVLQVLNPKLRTAAGAQAAALNGALSDLKMPSGAFRTNADQLAGARQAIGARITAAKQAGDNATAGHLLDVQHALDAQINAAVPEAGQFTDAYRAASRPLDVFEPGQSVDAVPNAVARDNFGNFNGTPLSEIPDSFLRGSATNEKLQQLAQAYGGNKAAAEGALEQHLANVARTAINPDGTLDAAKFAKAMQPYQKTLTSNGGVWFPGLKQRFANAQVAQSTLDTLKAQKGIGDSIASGGLRADGNNITASSFNSWLADNKDAITAAQGPQAVARLQQIGNALKAAGQGGTATALEDAIPAAIGTATGGADFGILGSMIGGKAVRVAMSPWTTKYAAAFNAAIENAVRDPAAARALIAKLPKGNYTPLQALKAFNSVVGPGVGAAPRAATTAALSPPRVQSR